MSINLTSILQRIQGLNSFFKGPNASRENGVVLEDSATVTWTTDGFGNIQATSAGGSSLPTATAAGQVPTATGPGTTYTAQAQAMVLIQEQTVSSSVASVTFTDIPQTFKHLKLVFACGSAANAGAQTQIQFNGDASSDYIAAANITAFAGGGQQYVGGFSQPGIIIGGANADVTIMNYTSAQASATGIGATDGGVFVVGVGYWGGTGPATSLTIEFANATDITSGVFSLYGLS